MNPAILRRLLWKEWREVQWKTVALVAIAVAVYLAAALPGRLSYLSAYRYDVAEIAAPALLVLLPLAGIFLGMVVAAGERERGTAALLCALPVRSGTVLGAKLAVGLVACLIPMLAVAFLALVDRWSAHAAPVRHLGLMPALWPLTALGLTVSTFLWTVAVGIRQPTQVRAGLAGLAAMLAWAGLMLLTAMAGDFYLRHFGWNESNVATTDRYVERTLLFSPYGYTLLMSSRSWMRWPATIIAVQAVTWVGLVIWAALGYSRLESPERGLDAPTKATARMVPIPVRLSTLGAVVWFQWRRVRPIAILCVAIVVGMTVLLLANQSLSQWGSRFHEALANLTVVVGFAAAILMGVGVFALDSQKRLERFWRSRPIDPALWFWVRYLTGAVVLLLALHGPVFMVFFWTGGWWPPSIGDHSGTTGVLLGSPIVHFFIYSAAVALVCLLRQPVYAGILAVASGMAVWTGGALISIAWNDPGLGRPLWLAFSRGFSLWYVAEAIDRGDHALAAYAQFFVTMMTASAVAAWLGYVAIKRDIQLAGG